MNIVILNDAACVRGGGDRAAIDSAIALASAGYRVVFFAAIGPVASELQSCAGLTVICLGTPWLRQEQNSWRAALRGLWNRQAAERLRPILAEMDPKETVVHSHLFSGALTASVLHASLRMGFATVLTLHDYVITCPNGNYFVFPQARACARRALSLSCLSCHCDSRKRIHKVWRIARAWLQSRVAQIPRRLSAYVAVSHTCAARARRDLPGAARIDVISPIVAIERQPPVDVARNRALVFTGRLEDYKGPQLLAQAAARLRLPVVFCGTGPLEAELRRINSDAVFTGWLQPAEIVRELGRARAFVFPSIVSETFGLSAAEALARGIPVVASRATAAEEFVHHGKNGLLFAHNSVDDLVVQLAALADDKAVSRMGATAYHSYWEQPLTAEAHLARLKAFYHSVVAREEFPSGHASLLASPAPNLPG